METAITGLDHCRELAMPPGSLFEFTSRYVPPGQLECLTALYALKQAISSIPYTDVDDTVRWAKLKWWSEELLADPDSARHPVMQALWQSGAREMLDTVSLQRLVSDAVLQIDPSPDADLDAMFERFSALGTTDIKLELALETANVDGPALDFLGAATSMFNFITAMVVNTRSTIARVPLNLLAKHNIAIGRLEQGLEPKELAPVIMDLASDGLAWFSRGLAGLKMVPDTGTCTHLRLRWAMENRQLLAITKNAAGFLDVGSRYGPADAWFAWRFLRRLK
jgi:phytoene/squalene synthetase